jgi:hypothetical protein
MPEFRHYRSIKVKFEKRCLFYKIRKTISYDSSSTAQIRNQRSGVYTVDSIKRYHIGIKTQNLLIRQNIIQQNTFVISPNLNQNLTSHFKKIPTYIIYSLYFYIDVNLLTLNP